MISFQIAGLALSFRIHMFILVSTRRRLFRPTLIVIAVHAHAFCVIVLRSVRTLCNQFAVVLVDSFLELRQSFIA